ncbi:hypothetical protein BV22DRAFT_1108537 [Leucogyrophana mollusca]|uniref:Uncharacterized protein n=1 Tax=Leucogyrophana mollusca TaxID=85980 RepID=A0ACB8AWG8_9AGAM|nr:hypothetical protein BV22DRAFT_1108537 [Leucogyrophana mollusca]
MAYPYPLPFPDVSQRTPVSSYSSLSNALGPNPSYSIYLDQAPVASPGYPYPARNVIHPAHASRRPLTSSNAQRNSPSSHSRDTDEHNTCGRSRRVNIPANYRLVPQPTYIIEPRGPYSYLEGVQYPSIHFQREDGAPPYCVSEVLVMKQMPNLAGGEDEVFAGFGERQLKVKIVWPGYTQFPFEKRVNTKHGELTRDLLLVLLARGFEEFAKSMEARSPVVERGYDQWALRELTNSRRGVSIRDCLIVGLSHREGCTWQPELFVPRG